MFTCRGMNRRGETTLADIFISYARADRDRIEKLAAALESEGYSVWWDRQIVGGSEFSEEIERELEAAQAVIVAWSEHSTKSRWVKDEAASGAEAKKLIPISIDGASAPMGFRQFHVIGIEGWNGKESDLAFQELARTIKARLTGEAAPAVQPKTKKRKKSEFDLQKLLTTAIMFAGIAVIVWITNPRRSPPEAPVHAETEMPAKSPAANSTSTPESSLANVSDQAQLVEPPRIMVASIKATGDDAVLGPLADALRDDIASGLSRFSLIDVAAPGADNVVRYRLDATLRQSAGVLRLSAQLIDIEDGRQVWGESYERSLTETSLFELQDNLTDRVVASVADPYGALMRDLQSPVTGKKPGAMTPYEAVLRHSIYRQRLSAEDQRIAREALQHAAERAPDNADVFAALAAVSIESIKQHYNPGKDDGERALAAARRAVEIDPNNAYAWFALAEVQYFQKNLGAFRSAARRAIELNSRDSEALAMLGILMGYAGDWDRGREWTMRAMALNPNHPGWYRFCIFFDAYRQENYDEALRIAEAINQPAYWGDPYARAMALGQLERRQEAQRAADELRAVWSGHLSNFEKVALDNWLYPQPELKRHVIEGLEKAGFEVQRAGQK